MIEKTYYEDVDGVTKEVVSINLSNEKYPNRELLFFKTDDLISGGNEYQIKAKWTEGKYHPNMKISSEDLDDFINALIWLRH